MVSDRSAIGAVINLSRGRQLPMPAAGENTVTIVQSGWIALFRPLAGGRTICVGLLGPGDLLLRDGARDEVVIEALTDSRLLQDELRRIVDAMSGAPAAIAAALLSLCRQTNELQTLVGLVLQRDIAIRLAVMLQALAARFGTAGADGQTLIAMPVSHRLLARMTGSNRVTVTRTMAELRGLGLVSSPRRNVVVVDSRRLTDFLGSRR